MGSFSGDQSSYLMGRIFGTKVMRWNFFKRHNSRVEKTKNWFDKYEFGAILLGRMTPSIRPLLHSLLEPLSLITKDFFFDIIACCIWALGLVLLVVLWEYIASYF